ncbi:VOC family protein [Paralimibaculum aggregatum]|uniref:VOC family protein n=1 Tax=Paralimibaculum aggregatum TaxID=3036245 RepID=A0ABQ6LDH3_9RHOB|nr:VOC family protein [Limibaculum sp. NKW23]GMG81408.1 VOC family protein [Limibaculum sp. NKW23]
MPAPRPYRTLSPYLAVPEAEAVAAFAREVFDAETVAGPVYAEDDGRLLHLALRIGDSVVLLGCPPDPQQRMTAMLHLYVEDCTASFLRAIAAGGREMMAPADQFYGDRAAGIYDMAGNLWWIAQRLPEAAEA